MTSIKEVQHLQQQYGRDWAVRMIHGLARATRRRSGLTDAELEAGLVMTIFDGDDGPLAEQLAAQTRIQESLTTSPTSVR